MSSIWSPHPHPVTNDPIHKPHVASFGINDHFHMSNCIKNNLVLCTMTIKHVFISIAPPWYSINVLLTEDRRPSHWQWKLPNEIRVYGPNSCGVAIIPLVLATSAECNHTNLHGKLLCQWPFFAFHYPSFSSIETRGSIQIVYAINTFPQWFHRQRTFIITVGSTPRVIKS